MSNLQETIDFTVKTKKLITFHLRMVGSAEERQLRQRWFGLTEAEKDEKAYDLNVKLLSELSVSVPDELSEENHASPAAAVSDYFKDKSPAKEHAADVAVRAYFAALEPQVFFV